MPRKTIIAIAIAIVAIAGAASAAAVPMAPPLPVLPKAAPTTPPSPPPPTPAVMVDPLTRIYRGSDGGALYLRQLDGKVYGFGEHPGLKYAYVLTGTVSGDRITGSWWDVPKGTRASKGSLELRWTQLGARIVRSGGSDLGPDVFTAIPPEGIPWPVMQAAGFQAKTQADLDGAFVGDDSSRHYIRESSGDAVWVAEKAAQPDERPGWVSVFIGTRKPGNGFAGTYVDVPKGIERLSGSFGAALIGTKRELMLSETGSQRTHRLSPDYTLDWNLFASKIAGKLDGKVVGYAYAIAKNGGILRSGAWGSRRLAIDGGKLPFTTHTQAQTASAAKTISAAAMIKALNDRGLTVDARVAPFLPSCIKQGKDVSTLTFRQLLNHTSGLPGGKKSGTSTSCNGSDPYECLLKILAEGRTQSRDKDYNNKAYDLLRLLVPLVSDTAGTKGEFDLFKCKNTAGVLHRKVSEKFVNYLLHEVLGPVGSTASFYPSGDFSLNYRCERRITDCEPQVKGFAPRLDFYLRSGSGKMAISALDYVRFLSALDRGLIIPKNLVEMMKGTPGNRLGFDTKYDGKLGDYYWKNGGCPDFEPKQRGCNTLAIVFPGDVQAYVTINSSNNTYSPGLDALVAGAFDAALK